MIEVSQVRKVYGSTTAVAGVSFTLAPGEAVGLLGLNGAGKSTTLRMLTSVTEPTSGKITVCGHALPQEAHAVRNHIGYMPDVPPLYPEMRVVEYLSHIASLRGMKRSARGLAVESVIERCNLASAARTLCQHLSRGFAQRVSLAQALLHDPAVLVLDEPTSGLDPEQVQEIRALLRAVAKNKTVLFSSHILSDVEAVCSRVLIMDHGRIQHMLALNELADGESLERRFLEVIHGVRRSIATQEAA